MKIGVAHQLAIEVSALLLLGVLAGAQFVATDLFLHGKLWAPIGDAWHGPITVDKDPLRVARPTRG